MVQEYSYKDGGLLIVLSFCGVGAPDGKTFMSRWPFPITRAPGGGGGQELIESNQRPLCHVHYFLLVHLGTQGRDRHRVPHLHFHSQSLSRASASPDAPRVASLHKSLGAAFAVNAS